MKEILSKFNKWDYIFLVLLGIGYYFLIIQYFPCQEDIYYAFDMSSHFSKWISSFSDAIHARCYNYFTENGRFIVHVFAQWFCGCTGPIPFFIGSSLSAILLVAGIVYVVRRNDSKKYIYEIPLVTLLLLLLIPIISKTYLGHIAFTMNYLWGSCLYIWFLIWYFKLLYNEIELSWWKRILLCLYAAICGQWQESFGIGIGGALFIYHLIHIRETKGTLLAFLLSFAIGLLTNILAPGNFVRSSGSGILRYSGIFSILRYIIVTSSSIFFTQPFIIFFISFILVLFINWYNKWECIKDNYIFIIPPLIAFLFAATIAFIDDHQLTMVVLMAVVLFCKEIHKTNLYWLNAIDKYIASALIIVLLMMYIPIYHYRNEMIEKTESYIKSILNASDSVADSHIIENYIEYELPKTYFSRYVNKTISMTYTTQSMHLALSHYLTKDTTIFTTMALPESIPDIVAQCNESNKLTDNMFRFIKDPNYFIVKIPADNSAIDVRIKYLIEPSTRNQKIKYFLTREKPDTVEIPLFSIQDYRYREFTYDGYRYIINRNDIYVTRYKDIKYLEVIY